MSTPKISVIVPVYNVGNYIYECLDSIINQTMIDDIEIIIVDDGSTDESKYIVDKYALDYENVSAYHKSNGGLGNARNFGFKFAKGEYVYFIDSDDYLPSDALEKLYGLAKKYDHDIVTGNFIRYNDDSTWNEEVMDMIFQDIDHDVEDTQFKHYPQLVWDIGVWNKIFKREFLEQHELHFPDKGLHEDNIFTIPAYYLSNSIGIISDYVYFWRLRQNSLTTQSVQLHHVADRVKMLNDVYNFTQSTIEDENIKKWIYHKILNMDFRVAAHEIVFNNLREGKEIEGLIKILKLIPDESINELITYRRLLIKMLVNKDFENMSYIINNYSRLIDISEQELRDNIDERYVQYINVEKDLEISKLTSNIYQVNYDDEKLTLFPFIYRSLCPKHNYRFNAKLIRAEESIALEVIDNKKIILPIDLIGKGHSQIKIEYTYGDVYLETWAQYKYNETLDYGDFEINLNSGMAKKLNISKREKNQNTIVIDEITHEKNNIILKGRSNQPASLFLENLNDFERIDLKTEFSSDNEFTATIGYTELTEKPVKNWTLKSDSFNIIRLVKDNETIYFDINMINFKNKFNAISIECRLYDKLDTINSLYQKLVSAKENNIKISSRNLKLSKTLEAYKSRKVVKLADRLKRLF